MNQGDRPQILIVQDEPTLLVLRPLLGGAGYRLLEAVSGQQALALAQQQQVDLVIAEIDLPDMDGYDFCRRLRQDAVTCAVPVVFLTHRGHINDKVSGFEAGADDYVCKPFEPQELGYRLKLVMARKGTRGIDIGSGAPQPARGRIIALFGTKGGVGRTTIGVNLAVALQRRSRGRIVLVDADFFFGDIALHLGLPPQHDILDIISRTEGVDSEVVEQALIQHGSGVRVLLSPRNPEDVELIQPNHVAQLLDYLVTAHDYILVDCQAIYDERTLIILEKADAILLIIRPDVGSVKNMAVFSELAAKLQLSFDRKIHIVLNRAGTKSGIGANEIERIFRRQIEFHVGSGGNAVSVSVNRGVPLIVDQPNHPFSVQVTQIADTLLRNMPAAVHPAARHTR